MAKQVTVPLADKSESARSARMWSKLTKRSVSASEAEDLDLAFSGVPAESNLGAEPMYPIQDDDEEPESRSLVTRANRLKKPKAKPTSGH